MTDDTQVQVDPVGADTSKDPLTLQQLMDGNSIEGTVTFVHDLPHYGNRFQLVVVSVTAGDETAHGVLAFHLQDKLPAVGEKISLAPGATPHAFPLVTLS